MRMNSFEVAGKKRDASAQRREPIAPPHPTAISKEVVETTATPSI